MKNRKAHILRSALTLLLCISMFVGSTFAWFTDSVTTKGNIIQSGTLNLEMYWTDDLEGEWHNVETSENKTIFDYEKWEPGYTSVRYIKLKNTGNLALNYKLAITPEGAIGKLAEVIQVYCAKNDQKIESLDDLEEMGSIGLLDTVLNGGATVDGTLMPTTQNNPFNPSGEVIITLAMSMLTTAGNEYQDEDAGKFSITAIATQASHESDSFGTDYDTTAEYPVILRPNFASTTVNNVDDKVADEVTMVGEQVSATVPAGVALESGVQSLSLQVTPLENTTTDITVVDNEILIPIDVHVEGVAEDNTVPIIVELGEVLPKYLNMGNYVLYHVEDGTNVAMTLIDDSAAFTAHNQYKYDPYTGEVTVAMATFSEVTLVANVENAWNGTVATEFADGEGTKEKPYIIANADQLAYFGEQVGKGITYDDLFVSLVSDINIGDKNGANENVIFYPIGYYYTDDKNADGTTGDYYSTVNSFEGTFDGNGHTISSIYQNTWEIKGDYDGNYYSDAMGLFGYVLNGTVKNLTVDNFSSDGEFTPTGVIAAYVDGESTFTNIAITNCNPRVYNTGNGGIIGIAGNSNGGDKITLENITVDNTNKISALWGSWDVACGGLVGMFRGNDKGSSISFSNCHVAAQIDVYNDVCANYQYYAYRYAGMIIGSVRNNTTDAEGKTVPNMTGISASGCTVNYGDWNDYYYCEFEKNSMASYSEDYQFSRVNKSEITFDSEGNVTGCTHTHTAEEDKTAVYLPFHQLFTGYSWGVSSIGLEEYKGIEIELGIPEGGITEGDQNESVVKFEAKVDANQKVALDNAISIGDLFAGVENAEIASNSVYVSVTKVGEENTIAYGKYEANASNWENGTVTFTEIGTMKVTIQDYQYCKPTELIVEVVEAEFATKFTNDYLYRVGNKDTVSLVSLFKTIADLNGEVVENVLISDNGVNIEVSTIDGNASATFTANIADWKQGKIQFTGTGVVEVTIKNDAPCESETLCLEVVDAYNRTTANFSGNSVLLNDVSTSSTLSTSGIIYGNGFTVNMENAPISEKNGAVFHLYDGAILKNLGIVGKEFSTVAMNVNDTNYGVSTVRAWGTATIENCYISGCRSAVSVTGTELTIKDSVIANGIYANIDFRSGVLNLHNITTINEPHTVNDTTVLGLGIVGNMTASAGRKLNITGNLTQYNWVSQADCANIKASGVSDIFNSVFTDDKYASLRYTYNGTTYVNTGILSLCSDFVGGATTGIPDNYAGMDVTATIGGVSVDGYVWAPNQAGTLIADDMKYHDTTYEWASSNQGTSYVPAAFDFSDSGLEVENGIVQVEYESGNSYTLSADTLKKILSTQKYGKSLAYDVRVDGEEVNEDIVFNAAASKAYTITYVITDNLIYDNQGQLTDTTYEITKDLKVFATVVDKTADAPKFTFYYGTNGSASAGTPHTTQPTNSYASTIKQIGEAYYIMPNVSATTANAIGSQTIDGVTVYYPIVDGINVRSGNSTDYDFTRYYPVFKAVEISDNGTEYSYDRTTEMPATVAWDSATIDSGNGASSLNDGFGLYNNQYLCKIQKKAGDAESGGTSVVKYSYTALDGNTYYYYVGYRFYDEDEGGACVTPDTLITLADGSQVRVDSLTGREKLLVWNHQSGKVDEAPVAYIVNHDEVISEREVIHLYFDNGKDIEIIGEHVFFDATLNKYVPLDENAEKYIGHKFVSLDENCKKLEKTKLVRVEKEIQLTSAYEVVSYEHLTCFTDGILSTSAYLDQLLNIFDVDKNTLAYNAKSVKKDIEKYGLYTYADFEGLITEEAFELYNAQYLKVAVGKGYITWDDILALIDIYFSVDVNPIK